MLAISKVTEEAFKPALWNNAGGEKEKKNGNPQDQKVSTFGPWSAVVQQR